MEIAKCFNFLLSDMNPVYWLIYIAEELLEVLVDEAVEYQEET